MKLFSFEDGEGDITLSRHKCEWPDQDIYLLKKEEDGDSIAFTYIELLMLMKSIRDYEISTLPIDNEQREVLLKGGMIDVNTSPLSPYTEKHPIMSRLRRVRWHNV